MTRWTHDHEKCPENKPKPRVYDETRRRYTIHEFKSARFIEAFLGTERNAELRCMNLRFANGLSADFFYRETTT